MFFREVRHSLNPSWRTSVNDVMLLHLLSCLGSLVFVDPVRLIPMFGGDDTKLHVGVGDHADTPVEVGTRSARLARPISVDALFEIFRKLDLVEEHPRIMVFVVEPVLKLPDAFHCTVHLLVPTEHYEGGVRSSELRIEGSYGDWCLFLRTLAVEQMRDRGPLAIRFVGYTEDRVQADLWRVVRRRNQERGKERGLKKRTRRKTTRMT